MILRLTKVIFFLCVILFVFSTEKKRIAIVHSFHEGFYWTKDGNKGILSGLFQKGFINDVNIEILFFYMDSATINLTPELQEVSGTSIAEKIIEENTNNPIEVVLVSDDMAFEYVASKLKDDFKIVFMGVNQLLTSYNESFYFYDNIEKPGRNVTGVYEYIPFSEALIIMNPLCNPPLEGRTVLFLYDQNQGQNIKSQFSLDFSIFKDKLVELNITVEERDIEYIDEFYKAFSDVKNMDQYGGIYPFVYTLKNNDESLFSGEVYSLIDQLNMNKPIFASSASLLQEGMTFGLSYDASDGAIVTGEIVGRVLNGEDLSEISIVLQPRNSLFFNLDEAEKLGITISENYLERATYLYSSSSYLWIYLVVILPSTFVIVVSIIMIIIIISTSSVFLNAQKKKISWMSDVANSISLMQLEDKSVKKLKEKAEKKKRLGRVEVLFLKITGNLEEYKPFLPKHLFIKDAKNLSLSSVNKSISSENSSDSDPNIPNDGGKTNFKELSLKQRLHLSMEKKVISVMTCKLFGLMDSKLSTTELLQVMNSYINITSVASERTFGDINVVKGESIYVSWNSSRKQASTHCRKGADTAIEVREAFLKEVERLDLKSEKLKLCISVFTGSFFVGTVGSSSNKFFSLLGESMADCSKLCKRNINYGTSILINEKASTLLKFSHNFKGIIDSPTPIFSLLSSKNVKDNNEWLYMLSSTTNTFAKFNEAYLSFYKKKYSEALVHIQDFLKDYPGDEDSKILLQKILNCSQNIIVE